MHPEAPGNTSKDWVAGGTDVYWRVARLQGVAGTNSDDCRVLVFYVRVATFKQAFHPLFKSVVLHFPIHFHSDWVTSEGEVQADAPSGGLDPPRPVLLHQQILKHVNWGKLGEDGKMGDEGGAVGCAEDEAEHQPSPEQHPA